MGALYLRIPIHQWGELGPTITNLPNSLTVLHFRLLLSMKYLNEVSAARDSARPPPVKRAQPRARGARDQASAIPPDSTDAERSIIRTFTLPSWVTTVQPLLSASLVAIPNALPYIRIKFDLLVVYGNLQKQIPSQRDPAWVTSLNDGALRNMIEAAFGDGAVRDKNERRETQVLGELLFSLIPSFQMV